MARALLRIRVELESGMGETFEPPPGRDILVGPSHTFAALAEAIDTAFARWDRGHLHLFELAGGRELGAADDEEPGVEDDAAVKVADAVAPGDEFTYTFDLGDEWRHRCRVFRDDEGGPAPRTPVPIFGWGWIPDQYGRETEDGEE